MPQDNVSLVRKLFECYNKNNLNQMNCFDEVMSSDVKVHDPAAQNGKWELSSHKQAEGEWIKAFPNKTTKIDSILSSGDQVIVRWTCTGTHRGSYQGVNPTNKQVKISGISIYHLSHNKISEVWQVWDHFGLLEQLGEIRLAKAAH